MIEMSEFEEFENEIYLKYISLKESNISLNEKVKKLNTTCDKLSFIKKIIKKSRIPIMILLTFLAFILSLNLYVVLFIGAIILFPLVKFYNVMIRSNRIECSEIKKQINTIEKEYIDLLRTIREGTDIFWKL